MAVYKYSKRLLTRALPLKFEAIIFRYNFLILATLSQILIFSNLILHNFILVSKSVFFFFEGIYLSPNLMRHIENMRMNLRQYQILKATLCKMSKVSPRTYIFQRGFLVDLYSVLLIFDRLNIQMWISRKELGQGEELLFLQVVLIEQVKRCEFISFIKR